MEKNKDNIIDHYIDYEDMQIGHQYVLQLTTGALMSGALVTKYEGLDCNCAEIIRAYTFALTKSKLVDVMVKEIETIDLVEHYNENHKSVLEYLEGFQEKHKVECFNDDGRLSNSTILGKIVTGEKLWDKLPEEEKEEFISKIRLSVEDIVEVINVCVKTLKENDKLHEKRLNMLDESVKLMDRYNEVQEKYQNINKIYKVFFNDLRIEELLKAI